MPDTTSSDADNGKPLSLFEKWLAGTLLILFTVLPALFITAYWPDRLPAPREAVKPLYEWKMFHVKLANIPEKDSNAVVRSKDSTVVVKMMETIAKGDSSAKQQAADTSVKNNKSENVAKKICRGRHNLIHINTLLLLLVASAGFLGNMIHIATSFTTYIGAGQFKRSWLLWYIVRPFTASALAVGFYFVFRGGFLNMSDDSTNINLYGVMTISVLAGLFTDNATQKLKEVFDVLFKPKDKRPNKLDPADNPKPKGDNNAHDQNTQGANK